MKQKVSIAEHKPKTSGKHLTFKVLINFRKRCKERNCYFYTQVLLTVDNIHIILLNHMKHYMASQQAPLIADFPILPPMKANTAGLVSMAIVFITQRDTSINTTQFLQK